MSVKRTGFIVGAVAGAGVAAAALAGVGLRNTYAASADGGHFIKASAVSSPMFAPPPGAPLSFADIFERVSPAVVSINVTSRAQAGALGIPGLEGLPFDIVPRGQGQGQGGRGGDDDQTPTPQATPQRAPKQQSSGSGFFISADGYIATNNHVIENAEDIRVVMKDGRELKATLVGRDVGTDLAVIKVQGQKFPFVDFENQAKPRVGDWVITIGNPFGLGGTATAGIISAYNRNLQDTSSNFVDYIQIDAPINRGNSGGPSFDIYGRVIGINSAIFSPSGGSVGIGFAIPSDVAENITKQLVSGGKITRGYIGASIQPFTTEMAESQGLGETKGAIVADLVEGGPAQKAGLQQGDIVTAVNGVNVKDSSALTREVAKGHPGDTLHLAVIRGGKRQTVDVRSGTRPSEDELASNDNTPRQPGAGRGGQGQGGATEKPASASVLGLSLIPLDDAAHRRYNLDPQVKGLVVDGVKTDSDAEDKGWRRGDVVTSLNNRQVASIGDAEAAVAAAKKDGRENVTVGFFRNGRPGFQALKIE